MPGIKELKTRIKSISGTRKVTRAMQMVSAAKMRKSQDATLRSRSYANLAWELITNLSAPSGHLPSGGENLEPPSPFEERVGERLRPRTLMQTFPKATKIAVLILSSNRGLVGSLNTNLLNLVQKTINEPTLSTNNLALSTDIITYGRKGREWTVRATHAPVAGSGAGRSKQVLADFEKFDRAISTADIYPISKLITELYQSGKYQKVLIFYNHFVSTLAQKPRVKQLLPFASVAENYPHPASPLKGEEQKNIPSPGGGGLGRGEPTDYLFEPNPAEVLQHLLPRIIESQIYQTILESEASEQSARMVMMKNATEAAGDLISDLTLTYNKLRQNKITTELAEITAGKIALE